MPKLPDVRLMSTKLELMGPKTQKFPRSTDSSFFLSCLLPQLLGATVTDKRL